MRLYSLASSPTAVVRVQAAMEESEEGRAKGGHAVCDGVPRAAWVKRGGVRGEACGTVRWPSQCAWAEERRGEGRRARRRRRHWTTIVWRIEGTAVAERERFGRSKGEAKPYVERSRKPAWPEHWYEPRRVWVEWTRGTPQGVQQVDMKRWLCGRRIGEAFETEAEHC